MNKDKFKQWCSNKYHFFTRDERTHLYSNISKMIINHKMVPDSFKILSNSMALAKNKRRAKTFSRIAFSSRDSTTDAPISNAIAPYIPELEASMLKRAELGTSFEKTLEYISRVSEINSVMAGAMAKLYLLIARWLPTYLLILALISTAFEKFYPLDLAVRLRDPLTGMLNDISIFTRENWYFILGAVIFYLCLFFAMKNRRPSKFRESLDGLPLFKQHRELIGATTLISLALEMQMSSSDNEAEVVRRVALNSPAWSKGYLMQMYRGMQSGRLTLNEGMAHNHLFSDSLKSVIASIQAVESDNLGLIDAALLAGHTSANRLHKVINNISTYIGMGVSVIMILLMITM